MSAILAAEDIAKHFGALTALEKVSLHVDERESVGLIGPNGAGKTTLFNVVLGVLAPDRGRVTVRGLDVTGHGVHARARAGMGRTFQRLELFGGLTAREHLLVAAQAHRRPGVIADLLGRGRPTADEQARADELLELVGLAAVADQPVERLSLGRARMVELGRALMNDPDLLLLDEPSSGLDRGEAASFAAVLRQVRSERGTALLFVEHDVDLVLEVVDRLYVMDAGRVIAEGAPAEVMRADAVRTAYLGSTVGDPAVRADRGPLVPVAARADASAGPANPPVLELQEVHASYGDFRALFGIDLSTRAGSVTALLGSNGAGKTTVARICSGLLEPTSGRVLVDGEDVTGCSAHEIARRGILHAPEGRSVLATLTVEENLELSFRALDGRAAVPRALERAYELFPRLGERRRQLAGTLSGGEQRMLSLARAFPNPPRLLIADELSLGLAPIIVDEVFSTLERLRAEGTAILVVEQHANRAIAFADHVVVLATGQVAHEGPASDAGAVLRALLPGAAMGVPT